MLFYVVRNPITDPPVSDYHFVEALLFKGDGNYLCRTNLGFRVIKADELERQLEDMVYVEAGLSKEEVRAMEQRRAVMDTEKAEMVSAPKAVAKSVAKRLAAQKGRAGGG